MTLSLCVRDRYDDGDQKRVRFGVGVVTRVPGIGALCPFASENGVVAFQAYARGELGPRAIDALDDGRAVTDVLPRLVDDADASADRQAHGIDRDGTATVTGDACWEWAGHREDGDLTAAGNLLASEDVLDVAVEAYRTTDREGRLAERLIDALAAGYERGETAAAESDVHSAGIVVADPSAPIADSYYNDLRVDASTTPIADLRETYRLGVRGHVELSDQL